MSVIGHDTAAAWRRSESWGSQGRIAPCHKMHCTALNDVEASQLVHVQLGIGIVQLTSSQEIPLRAVSIRGIHATVVLALLAL